MRALMILCLLWGSCATAETLIATRTIRAQDILEPSDVTVSRSQVPGALRSPEEVIGQEARVVLYAGRPIRPKDVGPPALINRNDTVILVFRNRSLSIATEGRALGRAGVGDRLRVMNLASRSTVDGTVDARGRVIVGTRQDLLDALE